MEIIGVALFVGALLATLVGFQAFDNWHKRKAWREAEEFATRCMRERRRSRASGETE